MPSSSVRVAGNAGAGRRGRGGPGSARATRRRDGGGAPTAATAGDAARSSTPRRATRTARTARRTRRELRRTRCGGTRGRMPPGGRDAEGPPGIANPSLRWVEGGASAGGSHGPAYLSLEGSSMHREVGDRTSAPRIGAFTVAGLCRNLTGFATTRRDGLGRPAERSTASFGRRDAPQRPISPDERRLRRIPTSPSSRHDHRRRRSVMVEDRWLRWSVPWWSSRRDRRGRRIRGERRGRSWRRLLGAAARAAAARPDRRGAIAPRPPRSPRCRPRRPGVRLMPRLDATGTLRGQRLDARGRRRRPGAAARPARRSRSRPARSAASCWSAPMTARSRLHGGRCRGRLRVDDRRETRRHPAGHHRPDGDDDLRDARRPGDARGPRRLAASARRQRPAARIAGPDRGRRPVRADVVDRVHLVDRRRPAGDPVVRRDGLPDAGPRSGRRHASRSSRTRRSARWSASRATAS